MQFLMEQKATLNIYEHNVRVATREVIFLIYWFFFYPDLNCRDAESVNNTKENIVNFRHWKYHIRSGLEF